MLARGEQIRIDAEKLRPSSSIADDVWHNDAGAAAYEWWYFDALSADGRDVLVVIFLSNFLFSPRYNRAAAESLRHPSHAATNTKRFPALAVSFYRDGRPLFRAINEYGPEDFESATSWPECRIGESNFRLVENGPAALYELDINTRLRGRRRLQARLQWKMKEGDFSRDERETVKDERETATNERVAETGERDAATKKSVHHWNMVAPRCEVTGQLALLESSGERSFEQEFRGIGYHDHNRDARWMPATIAGWQWGRFHFPAATAVFYSYREHDQTLPVTHLQLIRENTLSVFTPQLIAAAPCRHLFGLRYPHLLQLRPDEPGDCPRLKVKQQRVLDGSFFYLRLLSEASLELADGRTLHATGITEHLAPRALGYRWLRWLINMRIGSNGRGAFLP